MPIALRVLILEDRATDAELMLVELRRAGYEPESRRVDTERDYLASLAPTLDVILADYTLPQFDALRALRLLQDRGLDIPFIVVTGTISEEVAVECMKQGATDYLLKDRLGRLGSAVEHALQQRHLRDERRRAEEALRESEDKYRRLFESSPESVALLSLDGIILDCNEATTRIGGLPKDKLIGKPFADLSVMDKERLPFYLERFSQVTERQAIDPVQLKIIRSDNETRWLETFAVLLKKDNQAYAIQFISRDITERKRAEAAVRQQIAFDDLLRSLLTHFASCRGSEIDQGVQVSLKEIAGFMGVEHTYLILISADRTTWSVAHEWCAPGLVSRAGEFQNIPFGHSVWSENKLLAGEMLQINTLEDYPPEAGQERQQAEWGGVQSLVRIPLRGRGGQVNGCITLESLARPVAWTEEDVRRLRIVADSIANALERRLAEERIKRLNQDLERRARELAALNKAGRVMASMLERDALVELIMEQIKSLLDVEAASVILREPSSAGEELVFAVAIGPGSTSLIGTRMPATAGIASWVLQNTQPALVADAPSDPRFSPSIDAITGLTTRSILAVPIVFKGETLGVVEAMNKITAAFDQHDLEVLEALCSSAAIAIENARLYAAEQQRATAFARALEQQRELDRLQREFIQNVSHELRTPLAVIRGHAEVLESGWLGDLLPEHKESIGVIVRRAQMLSKMVDDIVSALEVERGEMKREPVDPAFLVRTSLADFQPVAEKASLTLSADIAPDLPLVTGDAMALRRALDNLVGNALKFTPAGGRITVRVSRNEQGVRLQVADTGTGIPSDQVGRIFERFYQVDGSSTRRHGGMGLGLALVKEIIEAHGGQVTAESQVGVGTTLTILLPIR